MLLVNIILLLGALLFMAFGITCRVYINFTPTSYVCTSMCLRVCTYVCVCTCKIYYVRILCVCLKAVSINIMVTYNYLPRSMPSANTVVLRLLLVAMQRYVPHSAEETSMIMSTLVLVPDM